MSPCHSLHPDVHLHTKPPKKCSRNASHQRVAAAEEDGCLSLVGATYVVSDDRMVDSVAVDGGPRVVTFAPVLKHGRFPLSEILSHVLNTCQNYIGSPVELEFAMSIAQASG